MGKLKDLEITETLLLKLVHEMSELQEGDSEAAIARVIIEDEVFDPFTQDFLLGTVDDIVAETGDNGLLNNLLLKIK